jgi:hypothetical protein
MSFASGNWEKIDEKKCYLYIEINEKLEKMEVNLDSDIEILHSLFDYKVYPFTKSSNWWFLFDGKPAYSCYSSVSSVFGTKVTLHINEYGKWRVKKNGNFLFTITGDNYKKYNFDVNKNEKIGKILTSIIKTYPESYLLFFVDEKLIKNFDHPALNFFEKKITFRVTNLSDYV